jgi:hypothetical protein
MSIPSRTWDSVCGDCEHHTKDGCAEGHVTTGSTDCIAAVCAGFTPKKLPETENGDA